MAIPGYIPYLLGPGSAFTSTYWASRFIDSATYAAIYDEENVTGGKIGINAVVSLAPYDDDDYPPVLEGIDSGGRPCLYIGSLAIHAYIEAARPSVWRTESGVVIPKPVMKAPVVVGMRGNYTYYFTATFTCVNDTSSVSNAVAAGGCPDYSLDSVDKTKNFVWLDVVDIPEGITELKYWRILSDGTLDYIDSVSNTHYFNLINDGTGWEEVEVE